jgi:hypothetical protein
MHKEMRMTESHMVALEARHAELDRRIAEEKHRPIPDDLLLNTLKKRKLKIKEELLFN